MSADLFAEFVQNGDGGQKSQLAAPSQLSGVNSSQGGFDFSSFGQSSTAVLAQVQKQDSQWPASYPSQQSSNLWGDLDTRAADDEDDTWGDFEVAEPSPAPASLPMSSSVNVQAANPSATPIPTPVPAPAPAPKATQDTDPMPRNRIIRASTIDLLTNNLIDIPSTSYRPPGPSWQKAKKTPPKPKDPNVLFDADDVEEGDDEFGDFEAFETPSWQTASSSQKKPQKSETVSMDLLSLADPASAAPAPPTKPTAGSGRKAPGLSLRNLKAPTPSSPYPKPPKSPSFKERNPFPGLAVAAPKTDELRKGEKPNSPSPVTAWPSFDDKNPGRDEDWAAFEDFPTSDLKNDTVSKKPDSWDWDTTGTSQPAEPTDDNEPPPTNVPPPSILMSILPELLSISDAALLKPIAGQTAAAKKKVMCDPKTIVFLRSYLLIATVAARILAGRKLRWHRDKFLSQRMTISAAGAKGMKLAGVDKAQASREDREAADVAASWKVHVGRLRSAVAAANAAGSGAPLRVPEIGDQMHVTTAKQVLTSPRPCVICGLKRDERVGKVDFEVEDSFGEWWVEHWGHRACRNFWKEHEKKLRQR